ncbi:unnamed protein product [Medioppia subpectinata]|uniref:Protein kinase domain-containing protein n=1 Tax=Medioppia subpectinata TaxID=1979941 RepID=A0A7R9Q2K8_9ACAR|nr:unnamed protein product [Medioppia subpectinata]CAG2110295.1 unnamed protein product [Medioppia subpectinata]
MTLHFAREESAGDERPVMSKTRREKVVEETLEIEPFTNEKRLANEFRIDRYLGAGSFGVVLEGRHKIDYKQYAIKLIYIFHENEDSADAVREEFNRGIREIRVWAKVQDTTCVQYRSAWLETSAEARKRFVQYLEQTDSWVRKQYAEQLNRKHFAILHIQMDLCWYSLKRVLIQVLEYFEMMNCREFLPPLGHYIGAELLAEIADALGRLHGAGVIHRDIKPDNILIRYDTDRRFVRMGDFGLAVEHLHDSHTHTRGAGADRYMAPEVKNSRKYNQKADMYSIVDFYEITE